MKFLICHAQEFLKTGESVKESKKKCDMTLHVYSNDHCSSLYDSGLLEAKTRSRECN